MSLRRTVVDLEGAFEDHLVFEETKLLPVLPTLDAWGPLRAEQMKREHAAQRAIFDQAGEHATSAAIAPPALAEMMHALVADMLDDMKREEQDLLHSDLLRDNLVTIDQTDG